EQLVRRNVHAERFRDGFLAADRVPGAAGFRAQQIERKQHRGGGGGEKHRVPRAWIGDWRGDHHAGREAALGLVLVAKVDDDEVQRQGRDGEIESPQAQRRQAEDEAEQRAHESRARQRDPPGGAEFLEQDARRIGAGREEPGMAERDLAGVAGEEHQRDSADRGEQDLVREVERKRRRNEGQSTSAAETMSEPASAPSRLSRPPTSAAGKAFRPMVTIVWSSALSQAMSMPAMPPVNVASAHASA